MTDRAHAVIADFLERAGWSAAQQFFAVLLTTSAAAKVGALPWQLALATSAGAAVASLVATGLQYLGKLTDLSFWPDLGVRVVKTFLASLAGSFGADVINVTTFDWTTALNLAAVAAITALGKGLLARGPDSSGGALGGMGVAEGAKPPRPNPSTLPARTYRLACGPNA